jgi:hypothetical protein
VVGGAAQLNVMMRQVWNSLVDGWATSVKKVRPPCLTFFTF